MSILDLKNVANQTVRTQRVCEVLNSLLVLFATRLSILLVKVINDGCILSTCLLFDR